MVRFSRARAGSGAIANLGPHVVDLVELLAGPMVEVHAAFPDADFRRADAYAAQRTGRRKVYHQQPVNGHFPYLPAIEYFAPDHFPWFAGI